ALVADEHGADITASAEHRTVADMRSRRPDVAELDLRPEGKARARIAHGERSAEIEVGDGVGRFELGAVDEGQDAAAGGLDGERPDGGGRELGAIERERSLENTKLPADGVAGGGEGERSVVGPNDPARSGDRSAEGGGGIAADRQQ